MSAFGIEFPDQVVKLKYFEGNLSSPPQLEVESTIGESFALRDVTAIKTARETARKMREGQSLFRARVLGAYRNRCAVTRESSPEAIEAARIQPYISPASNHMQNGIALRRDLHALFDAGLLAITNEYRVLVSGLVQSKNYRALEGRTIALPADPTCHPSQGALAYHRCEGFRQISETSGTASSGRKSIV